MRLCQTTASLDTDETVAQTQSYSKEGVQKLDLSWTDTSQPKVLQELASEPVQPPLCMLGHPAEGITGTRHTHLFVSIEHKYSMKHYCKSI